MKYVLHCSNCINGLCFQILTSPADEVGFRQLKRSSGFPKVSDKCLHVSLLIIMKLRSRSQIESNFCVSIPQ